MIKNEEKIFEIENIGCNMEGISKTNDGTVVFIKNAIKGEKVKAKVLSVKKNIAYAKVLEILEESKERKQSECKVFLKCGGCQGLHLNYEYALAVKKMLVEDNLKRIGKLDCKVLDVVKSDKVFRYRNKLQIPVANENGELKIGFFAENSHRIVEVEDCLLQPTWNKKIIQIVKKFMLENNISAFNEATKKGIVKHIVVREIDEKFLIALVITQNTLPNYEKLIEMLKQEFNDFSLVININKLNNNVVLTDNTSVLYGKGYLSVNENGIKYNVSINTFVQVNSYIKNQIYTRVFEEVKDNIVIDAFSGGGFLTAMLSKKANKVYGIEIVKEAVENADKLMQDNEITNVINICGACENELPKLIKNLKGNDLTVVLDPPRKGCEKEVLDAIKESKPNKIIYISCGSQTLARDLGYLMNKISLNNSDNLNEKSLYKIKSVQPFDMFPNTKHVETLAILEKI